MTREWVNESLVNIVNKYYDERYDCYFNVSENEEITLKDAIFNFLKENKISFLKSIEHSYVYEFESSFLAIAYKVPISNNFGYEMGLFTIVIE